jgi:hypothetical protein
MVAAIPPPTTSAIAVGMNARECSAPKSSAAGKRHASSAATRCAADRTSAPRSLTSTCESPIPSERVFANPVWNGHRLDVCLQWGANCGKPAADAFCRKNGFSESLHAESDAEAGRGTTRVIGTGQVCSGSFCRGGSTNHLQVVAPVGNYSEPPTVTRTVAGASNPLVNVL